MPLSPEKAKERLRRRKAQGICYHCSGPTGNGVLCVEHAAKLQARRRNARRKARGGELRGYRCSECGGHGHNKRRCGTLPVLRATIAEALGDVEDGPLTGVGLVLVAPFRFGATDPGDLVEHLRLPRPFVDAAVARLFETGQWRRENGGIVIIAPWMHEDEPHPDMLFGLFVLEAAELIERKGDESADMMFRTAHASEADSQERMAEWRALLQEQKT